MLCFTTIFWITFRAAADMKMLFTHFPTQAWLYVHRWSRGDCNCMGPYFLRKEMTEKRFCLFIFQLIRRSGPKLSPMIMYFYYDICSRQVHLLFKVPRSQERDSRRSIWVERKPFCMTISLKNVFGLRNMK